MANKDWGVAVSPSRWRPKPHQANAIKAVTDGFDKHARGQLIMACGTGKTLAAMWIAEQIKSSLTLVLAPSLSLVSQNLGEMGRWGLKFLSDKALELNREVLTRPKGITGELLGEKLQLESLCSSMMCFLFPLFSRITATVSKDTPGCWCQRSY